MSLTPFHIAFPVDNLAAARRFYGEILACPEGRSTDEWIDFDLFGHQIVAHLKPRETSRRSHPPQPPWTRPRPFPSPTSASSLTIGHLAALRRPPSAPKM